jgi:hypothetical protein
MKPFVVAVALFAGVACASGEDDAHESATQRCSALRDHLIDLRLQSASGNVNVANHREALRGALGADFVSRCSDRPVEEVRCEIAAKDTSSVAMCSSSKSQ